MFVYYNDGTSFRSVDPVYVAAAGEAVFPDYATEQQLRAAFPNHAAASQAALVPDSVTSVQARLALANAGLLTGVEAWVAAQGTTSEAYLRWHYAERIYRTGPVITAAQAALGLTDAQLDALFIAAGGIA